MPGKRDTVRALILRLLLAGIVLIASFALDGPAIGARGLVVTAVPKWLVRSLAHGGDLITLAALIAILLTCGLFLRRPRVTRAATVLASALAVTGFVVLSLEWLASRGPDGGFYLLGAGEWAIMFPSGHTAMAFAACTVLGTVWRNARWPAWVIAVGVAASRAILIHFLSDVVAGALIGTAVGRGVVDWAAVQGFLELDSPPQAVPPPNPRGARLEH
jgi:membrane-associated phospholipid phosphatase